MPAHPTPRQGRFWWPLLLLLAGGAVFAGIWVLLSLYLDRQAGWMAVLAAVDAALLLRIGGMAAGPVRMLMAVAGTLAIIAVANWAIVATQLGFMMGLTPWDSALKLGLHHAWMLASLANGTADLVWMGVAVVVAALLAR